MTKYMILKSFLALFILSSFSCAKKDDRKVAPKSETNLTRTSKTSSADTSVATSQSTDVSLAQKNSTDSTVATSSSADVTQAAPTGASKTVSTDSTIAIKPSSTAGTKSPVVVGQTSSQDQTKAQPQVSQKNSTDATMAKSQPVSVDSTKAQQEASKNTSEVISEESLKNLKLTDVKVIESSIFNTIDGKDGRVLFENYLTLDSRADKMITKRKFGLSCSFKVSEKLSVKDVLAFKNIVENADVNGIKNSTIHFESTSKDSKVKSLDITCNHLGIVTQKYFIENFYDVMDFKNAKGAFISDTVKKLPYADIVKKTKSLKITDSAKLMKAFVGNEDQAEKFGIVAGELVEETKSILDVQFGRAKQACAVIGIKEKLSNGQVFKYLGVKPGVEDIENNYATMQIYYGSETDNAEFAIECSLRRNGVGPEVIFETFKGILQYGAVAEKAKPAATKPK